MFPKKKDDHCGQEQARKPRSYASSKLLPTHLLTGVRCRATSVAKKEVVVWLTSRWTRRAFWVSLVAEHEGRGQEKQVSRDGMLLAAGSRYLAVHIWTTTEGKLLLSKTHFAGRNCSTALWWLPMWRMKSSRCGIWRLHSGQRWSLFHKAPGR